MLVVAFDGVLFDTLPLRASAIANAALAEGLNVNERLVTPTLASRSIAETVRECMRLSQFGVSASVVDETLVDMIALRAGRAITDAISHGVSLNVTVRDRIRRAAAVTRIVIRADSRRREVESLLMMAELDSFVSLVRCSDDGSPAADHLAGAFTTERSYTHIVRRMAGNMNLLGESSTIGIALEASDAARTIARGLGFEAPENFTSATLPGVP